MAAHPVVPIPELRPELRAQLAEALRIDSSRPRLWIRLRNWLDSIFEGHEELLGMTPD
jgi:hypothetical protein